LSEEAAKALKIRKTRKPLDEVLLPVRLYLDDVGRIVEIIESSGIARIPAFSLRTGQHEVETGGAAALALLRDELGADSVRELHVTLIDMPSNEPVVSVDIQGTRVRLYAKDDTAASVGVLRQLRDFLTSRPRKLAGLGRKEGKANRWLIVLDACGISLGMNLVGFGAAQIPSNYPMIGGGLAFSALSFAVYWRSYKMGSIIILKRRAEEKSYWQRNSDEIVRDVLVGLLVGAVFWVLSLIFK
jgi:hypothetical protein